MNRYLCGAVSDIGCERELQEDFVQFRELDDDTIIGGGGGRNGIQKRVSSSGSRGFHARRGFDRQYLSRAKRLVLTSAGILLEESISGIQPGSWRI